MALLTEDQFREDIGAWVKRMFSSQKAAAKSLHVSEQYLSDFLQGRRAPGAKLLRGLHAEKRITYRWGFP